MARSIGFIFFTRDRHPPDHSSFQSQGGTWPTHCVDGTPGFELHPDLETGRSPFFVDKGTTPTKDAYSGFDGTELTPQLKERGIERVLIGGLATDYCVKATVLDSVKNGFETWVIVDAIAAVNAKPGDEDRALLEMRLAGARLSDSGQILSIMHSHAKPTALIVVDVQRDFCPGGAIPIASAPKIIAPLNKLIQSAKGNA